MTPPRARIVRAADAGGGRALLAAGPSAMQRRRFARQEIEARLAAERIVAQAEERARTVLEQAREEARTAAVEASREAREEAEAKLSAHWLAFHALEDSRLERELDRVLAVGVALSERLLGAALELDPIRITELARTALAEARGARRAVIEAHPIDASNLERHLGTAGLDLQCIELREDAALARGELRLHTDLGTIDAKLAPRLERLASALRDVLG